MHPCIHASMHTQTTPAQTGIWHRQRSYISFKAFRKSTCLSVNLLQSPPTHRHFPGLRQGALLPQKVSPPFQQSDQSFALYNGDAMRDHKHLCGFSASAYLTYFPPAITERTPRQRELNRADIILILSCTHIHIHDLSLVHGTIGWILSIHSRLCSVKGSAGRNEDWRKLRRAFWLWKDHRVALQIAWSHEMVCNEEQCVSSWPANTLYIHNLYIHISTDSNMKPNSCKIRVDISLYCFVECHCTGILIETPFLCFSVQVWLCSSQRADRPDQLPDEVSWWKHRLGILISPHFIPLWDPF